MRTITPTDLKSLLDSGAVHLLDVRLLEEIDTVVINGSLHLPLHELPARHAELPRDKPLAVICHHGVRSETAARFLDKAGFTDTLSVAGGIDAYALTVDTALPRY
ncbi:MAG: rhodanese-like domain-containing protein [Pseudomonadota bacterium]